MSQMLFIAEQKTFDYNGTTVYYYELTRGASIYRIGTYGVDEATAESYNYFNVSISPVLASQGDNHLIAVLVPKNRENAASQTDQFAGWSYSDMAGRVANGQLPINVIKKFLRIRYTVDPDGPEDDGKRSGTIEEYEADVSTGKAWGRAYVPHKWFGKDYE